MVSEGLGRMPDPTPIKRLQQRDQSKIHSGVDTVRLKKDIAKDHVEHSAATIILSSGKAGKQEWKYREESAQKAMDREQARTDSLGKIRQGKKP